MSTPRIARHAALFMILMLVMVSALLPGCAKTGYKGLLPENQRPTVRVTQAPASSTVPYFYAYEVRWSGFDADGQVDHYLYCVDPPTEAQAETAWVKTGDNRHTFLFQSETLDSAKAVTSHGYHTFVVKAVDDKGLASAPVSRSFTSFTVAPTVQITAPLLNHLFTPTFGPSFRLTWVGTDPDGRTRTKPVKYKYKVFASDGRDFDFLTMLVNPDSLRRRYAPNFAGWDSLGGDTTSVSLRDLLPKKNYIAVVVAFDEVGAYSPVFNYDTNMLYFSVDYAGKLGPTMSVYNESFFYQAAGGSFSLDANSWVRTEAPADQPITFNWSAKPQAGGFITGFRWRVDGDVADETARTSEDNDIYHWSQWQVGQNSTKLPPFSPPPGRSSESHFFYIEGRDDNMQISIVVVQFTAVRAAFDRELLVIKDSRFAPDKIVGGKIDRPRGVWPTAAELDTFFFAVGGKPWKSYPTGTVSPVGVFQGYDFDTLGGRFQSNGLFTLQQLGHYRHIVWYADQLAAQQLNPPDYPRDPTTSLHGMSYQGVSNPLATWVKQGGKLWLFGGGVAYSLQREWEKPGTNGSVFSNTDGELVPGRFMYDLAHWRSEITVGVTAQAHKNPGLVASWPGAPDYTQLPDVLFEHDPAVDPYQIYAPNRTNPSDYYQTTFTTDAITKANDLLEPLPNGGTTVPLDTLYLSTGGQIGSDKPLMTIYHGGECPPLVYTGFPLWYFRRDQQISVIDVVLQGLWGLPRRPVSR
jgi:hypothetical protein